MSLKVMTPPRTVPVAVADGPSCHAQERTLGQGRVAHEDLDLVGGDSTHRLHEGQLIVGERCHLVRATRAVGQRPADGTLPLGDTCQQFCCRIHQDHVGVLIGHHDALASAVEHASEDRRLVGQLLRALFEAARDDAQLELVDHHRRQVDQRRQIACRHRAWRPVQNAQCSETKAAPGDQRRACIEADVWLASHEGIVRETRILQGILDHQGLVVVDRVRAKSEVTRGLARVDAHAGFEPLTIDVDQ